MSKFETTALDVPNFEKYCKEKSISLEKCITSSDFEKYKDDFSTSTLTNKGLFDPQFSDAMPMDGSIKRTVLPFAFNAGGAFVMVDAAPYAEVKPHRHSRGFVRFVFHGEFTFFLPEENREITLKTGEWVYIASCALYGYKVGAAGGGGGCSYHVGSGGGMCGGPH